METQDEAFEASSEWLADHTAEDASRRLPLLREHVGTPGPRGGKTFLVCARHSPAARPAVSASEAAEILGITRSRVGQLCSSGALESWRENAHRMVSLRSINERLESLGR